MKYSKYSNPFIKKLRIYYISAYVFKFVINDKLTINSRIMEIPQKISRFIPLFLFFFASNVFIVVFSKKVPVVSEKNYIDLTIVLVLQLFRNNKCIITSVILHVNSIISFVNERSMNMKKVFCFLLGIIFFILGCIGLILPVIPQIPFFIVSVSVFNVITVSPAFIGEITLFSSIEKSLLFSI